MDHFGDRVVTFLKNAATNLEELQVQTALGKAELSDKFEDIKKSAKKSVQHLKSEVNAFVDDRKESYNHLKAKLEHLELQLALGKADTMDEIREQKKKLSHAIQDVKRVLAKD
jgi:ribosomal protein L29